MSYKVCCLILIGIFVGIQGHIVSACTSYTHSWEPVYETKSIYIDPSDLLEFLKNKISPFDKKDYKWIIAVSPTSSMSNEFKSYLASSLLKLTNKQKYQWKNDLSPIANNKSKKNTYYLWIDIINATHLNFFWKDMNGPPLSMFRMGEFDMASIRILIQSDKKEILLIDEFPYQSTLENDIMLPTWATIGGIWLRRVSRKTNLMPKRKEWTVSEPPNPDDIQIDNITRIFLKN